MFSTSNTSWLHRLLMVALCVIAISAVIGICSSCNDSDAGSGPSEGAPLAQSKLLIEHNATDDDTGFQIFVDGEPWRLLNVTGPLGDVLRIEARGEMADFGFTEAFFETNEPAANEESLEEVLARFPEGEYSFAARSAEDDSTMLGVATMTHNIPAEPEITSPADEEEVDPKDLSITWNPVTETVLGESVSILGYQVIVAREEESEEPTPSFYEAKLSVFLPSTANSLSVPPEFLDSEAEYEVEVLAIEESGNQTIGLVTFTTE